MEAVALFVVGGVLGGVLVALLLRLWPARRDATSTARPRPLPTDVINMARIHVSGVGGLGMVAMAAAVALGMPEVGIPIAVGLVLGTAFAITRILWRRRESSTSDAPPAGPGALFSMFTGDPASEKSRANSEDESPRLRSGPVAVGCRPA